MLNHFSIPRLVMLVLVSASAGISQTDANLKVQRWGNYDPLQFLEPREWFAGTLLDDGSTLVHGGENPATGVIFDDAYKSLEVEVNSEVRISWTGILSPNTPRPSARARHSMVNTPYGVFMFGGMDRNALLNDFWGLDISNYSWTPILSPGPSPRAEYHMEWLPMTSRILLYGGVADMNYQNFLDDTWLFDPLTMTWEELLIPGPPARSDGEIEFVPGLGAFLFGGADVGFFDDSWVFDGTAWYELFPTRRPLGRFGHTMYRDVGRDQLVMHGGVGGTGLGLVLDDIWVFHEGEWIPSLTTGPLRVGATATYDPINECGMLVGGTDFLNTYGDAYGICSESPATIVPFGTGCAGTYGIPWLAPTPDSRPWIGNIQAVQLGNLPPGLAYVTFGYSNTVWGGIPLPLDLTAFGIWNCFAYASVDLAFPVVVTPGGTAQWQLSIPHLVSLVRLEFFLQVLALEAGINPFGAVTGNALAGEVGRK